MNQDSCDCQFCPVRMTCTTPGDVNCTDPKRPLANKDEEER